MSPISLLQTFIVLVLTIKHILISNSLHVLNQLEFLIIATKIFSGMIK